MNISIRICLLLLSLFILGSCGSGNPDTGTPGEGTSDERNYDGKEITDSDIIGRTAESYPGDICSEEGRNARCERQCRDIYSRRNDREICEDLTVRQISALADLYRELKKPSSEDLENINRDIFELYLEPSIQSLDNLISNYNKKSAENFLVWLIENSDVARVFEDKDTNYNNKRDDYRSLDALLRQINSDPNEALLERVRGSRDNGKIMELVISHSDSRSSSRSSFNTLEWFEDYINEKNTECARDPETVACFQIYCRLGDGIDEKSRDDWLGSEQFEKYIEGILDARVNVNNWKQSLRGIDVDDLTNNDLDDWVEDLCNGLTNNLTTISTAGGECPTDTVFFGADYQTARARATITNSNLRSSAAVVGSTLTALQAEGEKNIRTISGTDDVAVSVDSTMSSLVSAYENYVEMCREDDNNCYIYWPISSVDSSAVSGERRELLEFFVTGFSGTRAVRQELEANALGFERGASIRWPTATGSSLDDLNIYFAVKKDNICYLINSNFNGVRNIP